MPFDDDPILDRLSLVIAQRKSAPASEGGSYVRRLLDGGIDKIAAKVLEEAAEAVEAAGEPGDEGRDHLVREVADLVFHALVLLGHRDRAWADVEAELGRRFGVGGLVEKAARNPAAPE